MKKITAVISAAAVAATMAVPITAGASTLANGAGEQSKLNYTFDAPFTSAEWTPTGGTGTDNLTKLNSGVSDGKITLNNTSGKLVAIQKGGQKFYGDYTLSFDLTAPEGTSIDQLTCYIMDNDTTSYSTAEHFIQIARNSSGSACYVRCDDNTNLTYTGNTSTAYVKPGNTYHFSYTVANGQYHLTVSGGDWSGKTVTKSGSLETGYQKTGALRFAAQTTNGVGISLDNIKVVIDKSTFTADNITGGKYIENEANAINIATTKLFPVANTANAVKITKDGNDFTDYTVSWADSTLPAGYKVNPTITFNSTPAAGTYVLSFDIKDVYGYTSKPSWTFTVEGPAVTEASAITSKVSAEINGSVTIGGTTVTDVSSDNVIVGDKYISFYKTTVTAGDKAVNGMTIKPTIYSGAAATINDITAAANGGTASFYTAVINSDGTEITDWTYTFVE